jgi:caspase domain-containing protein
MRKSSAKKRCAVMLLLAACLSTLFAHGQKPPQKRQVKDSTPVAAPATPSALAVGSYHALIVGINNYQSLPKLQTAVNDANALAILLQEQYGFIDMKLLRNATRNQILLALNDFKHNLPENSNLLIYYAGHGYKDPGTKIAYWLPVDAQSDNDINWIGASAITDEIKGLHSAHVLVISDSCYSGDLVRGPLKIGPAERDIYLRRMLESPSRTLMSSGSSEPVSDGGKDGHSIFAYALLQSLRSVTDDGFTASDLFHTYIQQAVGGGSSQLPQYGVILNSGHEFGDFVFSRGGKVVTVSASPSPSPGPPGVPSDGPIPVSPEADRYAINQLVNAYTDSYNRKDAAGLWKVWPGAPQKTKQAIQNSFSSALSIFMKVTERDIQLAGTRATVTGQYAQDFSPRNGSLQKSNGPITLELEKRAGNWVITSIK